MKECFTAVWSLTFSRGPPLRALSELSNGVRVKYGDSPLPVRSSSELVVYLAFFRAEPRMDIIFFCECVHSARI